MKFKKIKENINVGISVLKAGNDSRLVVLYPRLEQWILEAAKEARVDIKKFGLPNDEITLHEIININLEKYKELLKVLQKRNCRLSEFAKEIKR